MENPAERLRILLLEDVPSDAELAECALRNAGLDFAALRVDGRAAFEQALDEFRPDIVLADYNLPSYSGRDALEYTRSTHPHIPVIIVTGSLGDEAAVELLKHGARDYVLKGGLARLAPAISRALSEERGIRNRKLAEASLKKSKDLLQIVVETAPVRIFWKDGDLRYLGCNTRFAQDAGFSCPDELTGKSDFDMGWCDQAELYRADDRAVMESGNPKLGYEELQTTPEGNTIWLRTSKVPLCDANHQTIGILGIYDDITEKKQGEIALQHANRALATLGAVNRNLVHATDEPSLLQSICEAIVGQRGYRMAVVGYVQQDPEKSIKIMASAGHDAGYLEGVRLSWSDADERGMGPSGVAVRSGKSQVCQDIANDPRYLPWRIDALKRGYLSGISLPLGNAEVFGVLNVYAEEAHAFTPNEIALLEEMAGDLAFGVHTLRMRQERDQMLIKNQQQLAQLRDNLEDTVRAISVMVEMRDPYTAGHQARVAELAAAIAMGMGLSQEQVHGIRVAGMVHDLGKIHVPAEILSKPGKLNDIEFTLIKTHPLAGFDILKDIDFPWPIAQIVLQHHERLDGSGYPLGLRGDQICTGARILSVADVVEAISSHRPYRPGLGIDAALMEIIRLRGSFYEPQAVDVCVALFREQGYTFSQ